ncbi:DUF3450 family protein [Coraliomargarita algicola]|uniref:DUF3450 family protein n=1 Tax=Coraliomargarita algicola TaxID=3092156 RepID=A0ABZ0REY6_9BACT|nr:DUF3450 family protein [Coraliomargarita sp. J2-16]WPJ94601.1 DUF3450 family protein [Coraliomargarita sp. J2-16]
MHQTIRLPRCAGVATASLACLFAFTSASGSVPSETRGVLQEWVKVKALISQEREEWATEKALIADTIELLNAEKEMLAETIDSRKDAAEAAANERTELSLKKESLDADAATLGEVLTGYESEMTAWVPSLPALLQEELAPLIRRLPTEENTSSNAGIGRRLQSVVGILSQVDKFNSSVTYRKELRDSGEATKETDTLYFGLAYAVYSDAEGSSAGYGKPGPEGWTWEAAPEAAADIKELIAVYKNETPAKYVSIPLSIQ